MIETVVDSAAFRVVTTGAWVVYALGFVAGVAVAAVVTWRHRNDKPRQIVINIGPANVHPPVGSDGEWTAR